MPGLVQMQFLQMDSLGSIRRPGNVVCICGGSATGYALSMASKLPGPANHRGKLGRLSSSWEDIDAYIHVEIYTSTLSHQQ